MNIVEIDVLDGRGLIQIAVNDMIDATRLHKFIADATKAFDLVETLQIQARKKVECADILCKCGKPIFGRNLGADLDLCDACYWRKRAAEMKERCAKVCEAWSVQYGYAHEDVRSAAAAIRALD